MVGTDATAQDQAPTISDIIEAWLASPHGDRTSEAFTHWNEDGEIPGVCAVCHSSTGAIDYVSGPMTTPGVIDHAVGLGTTVDCVVCHNKSAAALASVPFPSGVVVDAFGSSAICTVCHQGRASSQTVETKTAGLEDDEVVGDLGFINVHYKPSASTMMGGVARGGFEYPGKTYKGQFTHVPDLNTCTDCHSPHSLQVSLETCTTCHKGAESFASIRISPADFDGDGDTSEGIAGPIAELHARLGTAIQAYANEVIKVPVAYSDHAYPYFFADTDMDGIAGSGEAIYPNRYQSWTPRLLKAAYNYQLVAKETAIYTHNPHYALQLLYDSLENLSEKVAVDMDGIVRP
ncbi:MAG: polyheme membrane-associated cytochrome C [Silicimonas sp.]|nr:polyheme membrane-associated cytochrome C [Silicimonas sp.]